jgi:hypothetical protein
VSRQATQRKESPDGSARGQTLGRAKKTLGAFYALGLLGRTSWSPLEFFLSWRRDYTVARFNLKRQTLVELVEASLGSSALSSAE